MRCLGLLVSNVCLSWLVLFNKFLTLLELVIRTPKQKKNWLGSFEVCFNKPRHCYLLFFS